MAVVRKNLNQFRKVYPGIRKTPRYDNRYTLDQNVTIELASLSFNGNYTQVYTFTETYASTPTVTATVIGSAANQNVNIFISTISATSVTIEASELNTGSVNLIIMGTTS